jgi:hypothetical protein
MEPEAPETTEEEHLAKRARHSAPNLEGQDGSAGGEAVEAEGGGQDGSAGGELETGNAEEEGMEEEGFSVELEPVYAVLVVLEVVGFSDELLVVEEVLLEEEEEVVEGDDEEDEEDEEDAQEEEEQEQQQQLQEEEEDEEEDEEGGVGGEAGEGGEGGYDQYDEDEEEIAAMQRVTDLLETCSEDQLHKLFFDAVMRYKDDILLGHDEARNDLLVSACVQHPDFEQQIEVICTKNMKLMEQGGEDDPVELSSDESDNADAVDAEGAAGAAGAAGGIPDVPAPEEHGGAAAAPDSDAADAEGAAGAAGGIPDVSAPEEHGGAAAAPDSDEDL